MSALTPLIDNYLAGIQTVRGAVAGMTREQHLARPVPGRWSTLEVLCHLADPDDVDAALRAALLTDAEVAAGDDAWAGLPDPFGWAHDDPCADPEPAHSDPGTGDEREGDI